MISIVIFFFTFLFVNDVVSSCCILPKRFCWTLLPPLTANFWTLSNAKRKMYVHFNLGLLLPFIPVFTVWSGIHHSGILLISFSVSPVCQTLLCMYCTHRTRTESYKKLQKLNFIYSTCFFLVGKLNILKQFC